jgi:hypothetical protein
MDVIQLLVAENNKYYNHYLDTIGNDDGCYWLPDVTVHEIMYFWLLSYKWDMMSRTHWKVTGQLLNNSIHHLKVAWWNAIDFLWFVQCENMSQPDNTNKN